MASLLKSEDLSCLEARHDTPPLEQQSALRPPYCFLGWRTNEPRNADPLPGDATAEAIRLVAAQVKNRAG